MYYTCSMVKTKQATIVIRVSDKLKAKLKAEAIKKEIQFSELVRQKLEK